VGWDDFVDGEAPGHLSSRVAQVDPIGAEFEAAPPSW
jgi:hypothetical protein